MCSCANSEKNKDYLSIDNSKHNMDIKFLWNHNQLKAPICSDSVYMTLQFNDTLSKILLENDIDVFPNVKGCTIKQLMKTKFLICFEKSAFVSDYFQCTFYIIPKKDTIFSINENKKYYNNDRLFLIERLMPVDKEKMWE
jgi:hypothetical protein